MGVSGIQSNLADTAERRRHTIWGYPEYGASNCVRHKVSPGLDGLKGACFTSFHDDRCRNCICILGHSNFILAS